MANNAEDTELPENLLQDALQKWGYMITPDKRPSPNLDRLLRGIAAAISSHFGQNDHHDLTPVQLAAFYKAVGGNYDSLFLDMPAHSIAHIYKVLGCLHSLQPPDSDGHNSPIIPALKPKGFVRWQTIQLLLGPEEHVPFLQNALRKYDVLDPDTGFTLSKVLPASAFPTEPDADMVTWHHSVSERLRREAEQGEHVQVDGNDNRSSTELSFEQRSIEERANAAQYFSNPFNRDREGKPGIVRQIQQAPSKVFQGGKIVATTVFQGGKAVLDPRLFSRRKSSTSNRSASADTATDRRHGSNHSQHYPSIRDRPNPPGRYGSGQRRSPRRRGSPGSSSSDSEAERIPPRRMRRYRSQDSPPRSPDRKGQREFNHDRSSSSRGRAPNPSDQHPSNTEFRPSGSPPMAARMTPSAFQRPSMTPRTSSEHRSFYDQHHTIRHRNNTSDGLARAAGDSNYPSASSPHRRDGPPSAQYQPTQSRVSYQDQRKNSADMLTPGVQRQNSDARRRARASDQERDANDSDKRDGNYRSQQPPAVNGVGGRRYPKEAPWQ